MNSNEAIFTFSNGQTLYPGEVVDSMRAWLQLAEPLIKGATSKPTKTIDALLLSALVATTATEETGGIPLSMYLASGGDGGCLPIVFSTELPPEAELTPFAAALVGSQIFSRTRDAGHRFITHFGTHFGKVKVVDTPDQAGARELGDREPADMLFSLTTFDTNTDEIARWWLRVEHSGDHDKPLRLVPLDHPADQPFSWDRHWEVVTAHDGERERALGVVLRPGVERVENPESLRGQLDLRLMQLAYAIADPENTQRETQAEAMGQLNITQRQLMLLVVDWLRRLSDDKYGGNFKGILLEAFGDEKVDAPIFATPPVQA